MPIQLIVGLANPGQHYEKTRHNVGAWFADELAKQAHCSFKLESKFHAKVATIETPHTYRIIVPTTYMNHSGQCVSSVQKYYKIPTEAILIAHDDLDHPPGTIRLKSGGGHGGHNGLRDIISALGTNNFMRLKIGIGHPGDKDQVTNYVLSTPNKHDKEMILNSIDHALRFADDIISGKNSEVMNELHQR